MVRRHRAWCVLGIAMGLFVPRPSVIAKDAAKPAKKTMVEVQGRLVEYDEHRFWCTYHEGAEIHGEGTSPWARFELTTPAWYAGRKIGVWFKCGYHPPMITSLRSGVGQAFQLVLPQDFLAGKYGSIEDCDVGPAVAARWRLISAARR